MPEPASLRYLWAYTAADEWTESWHQRLQASRRARGFDVRPICVSPLSLNRCWFPYPELDRMWRQRDAALMDLYDRITRLADDRDVLILYNGANLHPEFIDTLDLLKVYTAGDDPESTEILTRPLAPAFDIHLVNNIACVDVYRSWGLKKVHFWPLGSQTLEEDVADLDDCGIRSVADRPIPVVFCGERQRCRQDRLDALVRAFPEAYCAGRGWPRGFIDWPDMWSAYRRAQIGWNVHNSTGPVNFRTYELAAYGVLQICDNRSHLGELFELGREVVGFDTIEECIELTRYYLAHPQEQRSIAAAGRKRWEREYTPDRVWDRLVGIVEAYACRTVRNAVHATA